MDVEVPVLKPELFVVTFFGVGGDPRSLRKEQSKEP